MKMFEQVNSTMGNQRVWMRSFIKSFFGRLGFAQCQSCAVTNVQDVNFVFCHGKKNPVFVLATAMKDFPNFRS